MGNQPFRISNLWVYFVVWTMKPGLWFQKQLLKYCAYAARLSGVTLPVRMSHYIEPEGPLNALVLNAAFDDLLQDREAHPESHQATLNAALQSLLGCERINGLSIRLLGGLVGSGCTPDNALAQIGANNIVLGMYVAARLQKESTEVPTQGNSSALPDDVPFGTIGGCLPPQKNKKASDV